MFVQVYCDESDFDQSKTKGRASVPTVYGYIAPADYWGAFREEWKLVLDDFEVPYFHFSELNKNARQNPKNPYYKKSDGWVDSFLIELSIVAGRVAVPCGSHGTHEESEEPYSKIFELFFKDCFGAIDRHWPRFKDKVNFFFEATRQKKWSNLILETAENFRKKDNRLSAISFPASDDKQAGLQLQAADLLAGSQRQNAQWFFDHNRIVRESRILDFALLRNIFPKGHRSRIESLPDHARAKLIRFLLQDKETKDAFRSIVGDPKKDYFPLVFLKEEYKDRGRKLNL